MCRKFRHSSMWRLVVGLKLPDVSEKCSASIFDSQREQGPIHFQDSRVQGSCTLQNQGTTFLETLQATNQRILCNSSEKWNTYQHESKNFRFFKSEVTKYMMLCASYLNFRFNFYFEQTQSSNKHTLKAAYTPLFIKPLHLTFPAPSSPPVLLIGEYRQLYCGK